MSQVIMGSNQNINTEVLQQALKANQISPESAKQRTAKFRDAYLNLISSESNATVLLMSEPGVGKTSFLTTCKMPMLIDHFDPKGTTVINDLIRQGNKDIIIRPWWNMATAYKEWNKEFTQDLASGYLSYFGTYVIDTITSFTEAVSYDYTETQGRPDNVPLSSIKGEAVGGDYNYIKARVHNTVSFALAQKCDVIVTGHLIKYTDIKNNIHIDFVATGKLKTVIPSMFTEKWILYVNPADRSRWIILDRYGSYEGSTQIGVGYNEKGERIKKLGIDGGPFEFPDMKKILEKCGLSIESKPSLI